MAYLFVSHDLAVVRHLVPPGRRDATTARSSNGATATRSPPDPEHPYTQRLLLAAPVPDPDQQEQRRADRHRLVAEQSVDQAAGAA